MKTSIAKDQRGLGHVLIILLIVVVLAVIGLVGWKVVKKNDDKDGSATTSSASAKTAQKACQKVYDDKDLCKFTGNYDLEKLPYKVVITTTGPNATTMTLLNDGQGNNSLSATSGGQTTDSILLNGVSYLKDSADGTWIKFPASNTSTPETTNPTSSLSFDTAADSAANATITYKKLGKEKCGKLTCLKYQAIDKSNPGANQYFWFDTKDYRLQRFYSQDPTGSTNMVITYQPVKISAPSPTKDFSAGTSGDSQSLQQLQQSLQASYGQ